MKRAEVMQQLEPLMGVTVKTIEHQPKTRVVVEPDQVILRPGSGGHLVPMNEQGVKSLANFVGMPQGMGKELSPDLFGRVTTELLERKHAYNVMMMEGAIVDFAKVDHIRNIAPERVIDAIEHTIPNADYNRVTTTKDYTATLEVIGEKREPVVRGDLVRAGALVRFSPIGTVAPLVQSFVVRLRCTNGAIDNSILREFTHGGEGDDVWQWFRKSIHDAYGALNDIVSRYRDLIKDRIKPDQRALILEQLLKEAGVKGEIADAVRTMAIQEPPRNTYEMFNLITWASSHLIKEPAQIDRARIVAAKFTSTETHQTYCPLCHRTN